jgi:hypothetical protein
MEGNNLYKSVHYHAEDKDCVIIKHKVGVDHYYGTNRFINAAFCKTHNVEICQCGWEYGFHFGTSTGKDCNFKLKLNEKR